MVDKQLKEKAIDIKGNAYVLVSDRVIYFNEQYRSGFIQTQLISGSQDERVVVKAKVTPDMEQPDRYFTGYSQAVVGEGMVNKTAALENAETSAVGRALAMMGIGVIDSIASADEMNKAGANTPTPKPDAMQQQILDKPCPKCGAEMKMSKKGNPYCSAKCWLKPADEKVIQREELVDEEENIADSIPF